MLPRVRTEQPNLSLSISTTHHRQCPPISWALPMSLGRGVRGHLYTLEKTRKHFQSPGWRPPKFRMEPGALTIFLLLWISWGWMTELSKEQERKKPGETAHWVPLNTPHRAACVVCPLRGLCVIPGHSHPRMLRAPGSSRPSRMCQETMGRPHWRPACHLPSYQRGSKYPT